MWVVKIYMRDRDKIRKLITEINVRNIVVNLITVELQYVKNKI